MNTDTEQRFGEANAVDEGFRWIRDRDAYGNGNHSLVIKRYYNVIKLVLFKNTII